MMTDETRDLLAHDLFKTEASIDALIGGAAALTSGVARMRQSGEANMLETQKPLSRLADLQQLLAQMRLKLTGIHGDLASLLPRGKDLTWGCPCAALEEEPAARGA